MKIHALKFIMESTYFAFNEKLYKPRLLDTDNAGGNLFKLRVSRRRPSIISKIARASDTPLTPDFSSVTSRGLEARESRKDAILSRTESERDRPRIGKMAAVDLTAIIGRRIRDARFLETSATRRAPQRRSFSGRFIARKLRFPAIH